MSRCAAATVLAVTLAAGAVITACAAAAAVREADRLFDVITFDDEEDSRDPD